MTDSEQRRARVGSTDNGEISIQMIQGGESESILVMVPKAIACEVLQGSAVGPFFRGRNKACRIYPGAKIRIGGKEFDFNDIDALPLVDSGDQAA